MLDIYEVAKNVVALLGESFSVAEALLCCIELGFYCRFHGGNYPCTVKTLPRQYGFLADKLLDF